MLAVAVVAAGFVRVVAFDSQAASVDALAISASLFLIVTTSVMLGTVTRLHPPTPSHPRRPARRPAAYHPPSRSLSTPVPLLTTPRRLAPTAPSMPSAHRPQPRAPMPAPSCIAARASSGALALALALAPAPALAWASTAAARLLWRPAPAHHPSCHTSCQALPLGLSKLRMDAAHASTSIQASRHATRPCPPTTYAAPLLRLDAGGRASPALCSMPP